MATPSDQPVITSEPTAEIKSAKPEPAPSEPGSGSLGNVATANRIFATTFIWGLVGGGIIFCILAGGFSGLQWAVLLLTPLLYTAPILFLINFFYLIEAIMMHKPIPPKYYLSFAMFVVPVGLVWALVIFD